MHVSRQDVQKEGKYMLVHSGALFLLFEQEARRSYSALGSASVAAPGHDAPSEPGTKEAPRVAPCSSQWPQHPFLSLGSLPP